MDDTIATGRRATGVGAAVSFNPIAIVAFLIAWVLRLKAGA